MGFLAVFAAALASYVFGAIWYMLLSKQWVQAADIDVDENGRPLNASNPMPYITAFVCSMLVAGMMRHMFALSNIDSLDKGLMSGLGIGLFLAAPWLVTCYGFSGRSRRLMVIDGFYAVFGCAFMGTVLTLF